MTPSAAVDQTYTVNDSSKDYDISLTAWSYRAVEPRTLVWSSWTNTQSGVFPITVTAENSAGLKAEVTWNLIVDPNCDA